jgi:tetratricopeptide (TPR) repeat protein
MLADLSVTPFAKVLRRLSAERRNGDLQIHSRAMVKTVFFDHGRVVFAASNLKRDRLGESLVAMGHISEEDFRRASQLMKESRRRFGEALILAGVLDKRQLGTSVARQVRRIILSLFNFTDGLATFEDRRCPIPLEYMVSFSVHRLLYDGVKTMTSPELVTIGLDNLDRWVMAAESLPFLFDIEACPVEEREILAQAARRATLRRLAWAPGGIQFERLRSVYGLLSSGLLREADETAVEPQPGFQTETGLFLLSALQKRPDPSAREAILKEVKDELERSSNLDRENWLRISRAAPRDELLHALEDKMERYQALLEAVGDDEALRTDIELILGRASSLLRLTRQQPQPAQAQTASPSTVPIDAFDIVPEPPEPRTEAPPSQPQPPLQFAPAEAAAPTAPSDTDRGILPVEQQARYLLMEGELRMTVGDFANAVRTYSKLVNIMPEEPELRIRLALAMALYPRTAKHAEREFLEALRLSPNNAEYHYQFGLYYKAMRQRSRAVVEFRAALSIKPHHEGAREELAVLSPKDPALKGLRRLLR